MCRAAFKVLTVLEKRTSIAIVDDEQAMLRAVDRLLTAHGFITQTFPSAEAYLDSRSARDAACLVLDIHLGDMSGIELGRHLKAVRSTLPIIFITAADDDGIEKEALDIGCIAYLRKPFPAQVLIDAIAKALG